MKYTKPDFAWIKEPNTKQLDVITAFNTTKVITHVGGARTGKTELALFVASQYVDVPDYNCLVLGDSIADMCKSDNILHRAITYWAYHKQVKYVMHTKQFTFRPSGATITFGYLNSSNDHYLYQGSEFSSIIIDKDNTVEDYQVQYLMSRIRAPKDSELPERMLICSKSES